MRVVTERKSPNFDAEVIQPEFIILHYTGCDLEKTLEIFENPAMKVAAHFVIDLDGCCYDLGDFLNQPIRRAAHAGVSRWKLEDGHEFEGLNRSSIGIEIVNYNGNIFSFAEAQYETLRELIQRLQAKFPVLKDSARFLGHEHIAGFRGKADPGLLFDWPRVLSSVGLQPRSFHAKFTCVAEDLRFLEQALRVTPPEKRDRDFWPALSTQFEKQIRERLEKS